MSEEARDLNADLAAAWEAAESSDDTMEAGESGQGWPEPEESSADSAGLAGEGVAEGDSEESGEADASGVQPDGAEPDGPGQAPEAAEEPSLETPPAGLSPEAREAWKDTPTEIKKAVAKREKDYEAGIMKYAEQAKRAEGMDRALQPYQQLFQMNGGAGQFLPSLLQTASLLQMGTPQQKAQMAANIIKQFGVDIKTLDNVLVGEEAPPEVQQQSQMEQLLNQRLAPLQQQIQQYQQREQYAQQETQGKIQSELEQFAAQNEFYNDVRGEMADLMELSANRGREMSLDEAYRIACSTHPTISKIIDTRNSQQQVQQKRQAASSVSGGPGGTMEAPKDSIQAALLDAWDNAGRM